MTAHVRVLCVTLLTLLVGTSPLARAADAPSMEKGSPAKKSAPAKGMKKPAGLTIQPCTNPPAGAITHISGPLANIVTVYCTNYGHILGPVQGYEWINPKKEKAIFPAQNLNHHDLSKVDPNAHFIELEAVPPSAEETQDIVRIMKAKRHYASTFKHNYLIRLSARSSAKVVYTLYFALFSNDEETMERVTGLGCAPDCLTTHGPESGMPFVVLRKEPQSAPRAKK